MVTGKKEKELYPDIGALLRVSRERLGLTQQMVAEHVGVSKSAISRWESGEVENMGRSSIKTLAGVLGISPTDIVVGSGIGNLVEPRFRRVPLLGEIAAGQPILAMETPHTYVEFNCDTEIDFCLKVKGDSMIDARINDGDLVFVREQPEVENGEIAVVLIDNEATLKRVYYTDGGVILKPENSKYKPMFFTERDFKDIRVLGKAIMLQTRL